MARRRENERKPRAVTAAATRVKLADRKAVRRHVGHSQPWQAEAFAYCNEVPELKRAMRFLGDSFAKLRIFAAVRPLDAPADAAPIPITDEASDVPPNIAALAEAKVAALRSTFGGQAAFQARLNANMEQVGEAWLVHLAANAGEPEEWKVCSISELFHKDGKPYLKRSPNDTEGRALDESRGDEAIRIWQPSDEWEALADSAMRGVVGECKTLQVLSQQVLAQAMSHQSAGLLLVPNELSFGSDDPTEPEAEDGEGDPFLAELMVAVSAPIEDPSSAASVMPMVVRGEGEQLERVRHLTLARDSPDVDARIEVRVRRIARGLNLPVEVVLGHQETTFANAEQVDQDTFEDHLEPRCDLLVDALTVAYLRPELADEAEVPPEMLERICVWYDASRLVAKPNVEQNAPTAHAAFLISDATARQALGFTEDDAPDALEVLARVAIMRGQLAPALVVSLLQQLADDAGVELPEAADLVPVAQGDPNADANAMHAIARLVLMSHEQRAPARSRLGPPQALEAAARPQRQRTALGRRLMELDRDLRTRLQVAANDAMNRALERASNRMRSKANGMRARLAAVPAAEVPSRLRGWGALTAASTEEALAGAWDDLEQQFMAWGRNAQTEALEMVGQVASGFSVAERQALGLRQADDLGTAWSWFRESLQSLAGARLFDPDPAAPPLGEFDPTMKVPTGMVRQAIARAGGDAGLIATDKGGAFLALSDAGTRPAGGIGTGEAITGALRDEGLAVEGYRWVYGPAMRLRPFEPHMALDGLEFVNFDDPALANPNAFPEFGSYMPGDHAGCICDVEPIIMEGAAAPEGEPEPDDGELSVLDDPRFPGDMSAKDATGWMADRWGTSDPTDTARRFIDVSSLGREGANAVASALDELFRAYPQVAERVRIVGGSPDVTKAAKVRHPQYRIKNIGGAYADATPQLGWIRVNAAKVKRYSDTLDMLAQDVRTGFHPPGTASIESVVRHEFGHHVKWAAEQAAAGGRAQVERAIDDVLMRHNAGGLEYDKWRFSRERYEAMREVSGYAAKNRDELIAEAFSEVTTARAAGTVARQLSRDLVDAVESFLPTPTA